MANRGDILLVLMSFSDGSGAKVRPGVVVSWDKSNRTTDDIVIAQVTTNTARVGHSPTQVLIDLATTDGRATGLLTMSVVRCEFVATVHKSHVHRFIGRMPPALMAHVDAALKIALDLP